LETLSDGWVSHSTLARPAGKLFNGDHDRPALTLSLYQQYSVQVLKAKQRPGVPTTLPMFVISLLTAPTKVKRANALVFAVHVLMIPANVVTEKKGSGGAQPEPELELELELETESVPLQHIITTTAALRPSQQQLARLTKIADRWNASHRALFIAARRKRRTPSTNQPEAPIGMHVNLLCFFCCVMYVCYVCVVNFTDTLIVHHLDIDLHAKARLRKQTDRFDASHHVHVVRLLKLCTG
jgi:hypothetical protein